MSARLKRSSLLLDSLSAAVVEALRSIARQSVSRGVGSNSFRVTVGSGVISRTFDGFHRTFSIVNDSVEETSFLDSWEPSKRKYDCGFEGYDLEVHFSEIV